MPDPIEMTTGVQDALGNGLGLFRGGIDTLSQMLSSTDSALRQVDGALTGGRLPTPGLTPGPANEEELLRQVTGLVRQGESGARQTGPRAPGVVNSFQEVLRLLFQFQLPSPDAISDLLPSTEEMVRLGLRDLRGSMALARLAGGRGTLNDVGELTRLVEDLVTRGQQAARMVQQSVAASPEVPTPAGSKGPKGRRKGRLKAPKPESVAFAQAVAQVMGDPQVLEWSHQFAEREMSEKEWTDNLVRHAEAQGLNDLDDVYSAAVERMQGTSNA